MRNLFKISYPGNRLCPQYGAGPTCLMHICLWYLKHHRYAMNAQHHIHTYSYGALTLIWSRTSLHICTQATRTNSDTLRCFYFGWRAAGAFSFLAIHRYDTLWLKALRRVQRRLGSDSCASSRHTWPAVRDNAGRSRLHLEQFECSICNRDGGDK